MLTAHEIHARLRQQPFKPFRLVTSSGEYEIPHPEMALVTRRAVIVGLPGRRDTPFPDRYAQVSVLHVTAMDDLEPAERSDSDGESNKGT